MSVGCLPTEALSVIHSLISRLILARKHSDLEPLLCHLAELVMGQTPFCLQGSHSPLNAAQLPDLGT